MIINLLKHTRDVTLLFKRAILFHEWSPNYPFFLRMDSLLLPERHSRLLRMFDTCIYDFSIQTRYILYLTIEFTL